MLKLLKKHSLMVMFLCCAGWSQAQQENPDPMHIAQPVCDAKTSDGADINTPVGTPVEAPADGKVLRIWNDKEHGCGATILIQHKDGSVTGLAHLSGFYVKVGDQVSQGEKVADSGQSGNATSPTLHLTLFSPKLGKIDPLKAAQDSADWKRKNAFSATTSDVLKRALLEADNNVSDPVEQEKIKQGILEQVKRNRYIAEVEYCDNLDQATDTWYANNGDYKKIPPELWNKLRELDKFQFKHSAPGKEILSTARKTQHP